MKAPEKMAVRRQSVAHPFGTIKAWMGATHFLTKTLGRVSTEMSLHVLERTNPSVHLVSGFYTAWVDNGQTIGLSQWQLSPCVRSRADGRLPANSFHIQPV